MIDNVLQLYGTFRHILDNVVDIKVNGNNVEKHNIRVFVEEETYKLLEQHQAPLSMESLRDSNKRDLRAYHKLNQINAKQ